MPYYEVYLCFIAIFVNFSSYLAWTTDNITRDAFALRLQLEGNLCYRFLNSQKHLIFLDEMKLHVTKVRMKPHEALFKTWERGGVLVERRTPGFDPHRRHRVVSLSKTH